MVSVVSLMDIRTSPASGACLCGITLIMLTVGLAELLGYVSGESAQSSPMCSSWAAL